VSIDELLSREFDRSTYNCLHYSADCWEFLTGDDRLKKVREDAIEGQSLAQIFREFRKCIEATVAPSIALMDTLDGKTHMGVCYRRRLLHINEAGCQFLPVDAFSSMYKNMRFYQ